ncbi:MAG: FAD-dependent oxidoreductase [Dehalococcoidales bacterium]|nr:FAD-dependent oxidoreductase [Dehalococcoidales bacterium]
MWNEVTDVIVAGYGGAGAAAAIAAHDAGARVIVLEKSDRQGGNTRLAGGTLREFLDTEKAIDYFGAILDNTVSREVTKAFIEESAKNPEWVIGLGGELEHAEAGPQKFPPSPHVIWPHLPGADGVGGRWLIKGKLKPGGSNLCAVLEQAVNKRGIKVLFHTPARKLITDESKRVIGVVADSPQGEIRIKAERGVILTCGGFQYNEEMQLNYLGLKYYAQGCKGNTGDGIKMALEVGADLWHMRGLSCGIGYKFPEFDIPMGIGVRTPGYIYVDQTGKRFIDETGVDVHAMAFEFSYLDHKTLTYPRLPAYIIFDENTRSHSPLIGGCPGAIMDYYTWSDDNMAEIEKGWIKTAPTIRELAPKIGLREETLQETVSRYNMYCVGGYDPDFGRRQETFGTGITKPPFYAIGVWPCLLNTQGGPKRNEKAQVLDTNNQPIKGLYSAGELGSIFNMLYPGAGNISECMSFGRIAGRNAANEKP